MDAGIRLVAFVTFNGPLYLGLPHDCIYPITTTTSTTTTSSTTSSTLTATDVTSTTSLVLCQGPDNFICQVLTITYDDCQRREVMRLCPETCCASTQTTSPVSTTTAPLSTSSICLRSCDACEGKAKLVQLRLVYTAASTVSHGQDEEKVTVVGSSLGIGAVEVEVYDKNGNLVGFFTNVHVGDTMTVLSTSFSNLRFSSEITVVVIDPAVARGMSSATSSADGATTATPCAGTSCATFHTSCSQLLRIGDQFGDVAVSGFLNDDDRTEHDCACEAPTSAAPVQCDACVDKAKLTELRMRYTGADVVAHAQETGKVSVSGSVNFAAPVDIFFRAERGNDLLLVVYNVHIGDSIALRPGGKFTSSLVVEIFATNVTGYPGGVTTSPASGAQVLAISVFHTSCSQPLSVSDTFGAIEIIGFSNDDGVTFAGNASNCLPPAVDPVGECDACESKVKIEQLLLRYTGGNVVYHSQSIDKVDVVGNPDFTTPVDVSVVDERSGSLLALFVNVSVNDIVTIDAPGGLPSSIILSISDASLAPRGMSSSLGVPTLSGDVIAVSRFHTSCSQPLRVGDTFGSIRVAGFLTDSGVRASATCDENASSLRAFGDDVDPRVDADTLPMLRITFGDAVDVALRHRRHTPGPIPVGQHVAFAERVIASISARTLQLLGSGDISNYAVIATPVLTVEITVAAHVNVALIAAAQTAISIQPLAVEFNAHVYTSVGVTMEDLTTTTTTTVTSPTTTWNSFIELMESRLTCAEINAVAALQTSPFRFVTDTYAVCGSSRYVLRIVDKYA